MKVKVKVEVNKTERARVFAARGSFRNAELATVQAGALRSRLVEGERRKQHENRSRRKRVWTRESQDAR